VNAVTRALFLSALTTARYARSRVGDATSAPEDIGDGTFYLSDDGLSGYGVTTDGTLVGVFSLAKGRGDAIVSDAISHGARSLDCFDGYLVKLYARHGFTVTKREANWTHGEPDVCYMNLTA
jgi:hypothetical protein